MTDVTIPHPREDAKTVVKAAFEDCSGFKTYHDNGRNITGKTGASMGLIKSSYGEKVTVEFPNTRSSANETVVQITGEKEVSTNIGADPEKYVTQLRQSIESIKNHNIEMILKLLEEENIHENNKEVSREADQAGGSWFMIVAFVVLMFLFMMMFL